MSHTENSDLNLSFEEKRYQEFMLRGNDFFKIELFKSAKEMYKTGLEYKADDHELREKIRECNKLIRRDTRRILIVLPFIIVAVMSIIMYKLR